MSFDDNRGIWLMVGGTAAAAAVLLWILFSAQPLRLIILFDDVGGLKRDDPVVWRGTAIGKVEDIKPADGNRVEVTVRIREDHAAKLTHGTEFILKRASFFGLVGNNAIEAATPPLPGAPYSSGESIQGKSPAVQSLVEQGKRWTSEYWLRLKEETSELIDALGRSNYQNEFGSALDRLKVIAEDGARAAKDGLENFRQAHQQDLDEILKQLERLRDEMRSKGDERHAVQVEKEIERLKGSPQP